MPSRSSTPSKPDLRFHGLDTLRAAAILLVMLYHLNLMGMVPALVRPLAKVGWVGVDLFFVLSGFLIGSQLLKPYLAGAQPSLKDFYVRRAYRILPALFVVLALYLLLPLWREAPGPYAAWQYGTFTWNLLLLGYPEHRAFSHIWSLCVEEHFYLCLPLLILLMMRKPSLGRTTVLLLFLVLGGCGLRAWILSSVIHPATDEQGLLMMKYIYYPTYSRLDGLVLGVSLALLRTFKGRWWSRIATHGGGLLLAGCALLAGGLWLCDFDYPSPDRPASILFAFPVLACGFGLLVAAAIAANGMLRRKIPGASALAALAYSLYLTHKSVAHATHQLLPVLTADAGWQSFVIYLLACLAVAALLYGGVERVCIARRIRTQAARTIRQVETEVRLDPAI